MWKIQEKGKAKATKNNGDEVMVDTITYYNTQTQKEFKITQLYLGDLAQPAEKKYYIFDDIMSMPIMRKIGATKVEKLFGKEITPIDQKTFAKSVKEAIDGGMEREAMMRLWGEADRFERSADIASDSEIQYLGLASIYILEEGEQIDYWAESTGVKKIQAWKANPEMASFFLRWVNKSMDLHREAFSAFSRTVSNLQASVEQE